MTSSDQLELLLAKCAFPSFDARDLPRTVAAVVATLRSHSAKYAIVGRLALARWRPQCTDLIEVRALARDEGLEVLRSSLDDALVQTASRSSTVKLKLALVTDPFEEELIGRTSKIPFLGMLVRMAKPEHLLWLAACSKDLDYEVDAIHLLQSSALNDASLNAFVSRVGPKIGKRVQQLAAASVQAKNSTYCASVERRLAERLGTKI